MKTRIKALVSLLGCSMLGTALADNQTSDVSPVLSGSALPFRVTIQQANFQLPVGFHSGAVGSYNGYWIFIAGRTNGLHGFNLAGNFPPEAQNKTIYVVNSATGASFSRSLSDPNSGLNQQQIDSLSVTSPEQFQDGTTLYMAGGYGFDTSSTSYTTKSILTAFNLPGVLQWVMNPGGSTTLAQNIRQINNPVFQVTGGRLFKLADQFVLVFGQNFPQSYTPGSNGTYSDQVRIFQLTNTDGQFSVTVKPYLPTIPDDTDYRRRDLNVMPVLLNRNNQLQYGMVAYAGVFTLTSGVWTVPVVIDNTGNPTMANPLAASTFKQAMNQYVCASIGLYSRKYLSMYDIFFGGLTYGFFTNGVFNTDSEIPFTNEVTTIRMDNNGNFSQYLMDGQYPTILSTGSNPGNVLLFGAGAYFIPTNIQQYQNKVLNLDSIRQPTVIGYIVGGIASTLANTNVMSDSTASPYVFAVTLTPTSLQAAKKPAKKVVSNKKNRLLV